MYTETNFKTKKALKEAVAAGKKVAIYQPNNMFGTPDPSNGKFAVEGPHYPAPHAWYAMVTLVDGFITKVS
jgi:hypothetical protein